MKIAMGVMFAIAAGVGVFVIARPRPANEYPLPLADAYQKLANAQLKDKPKSAFGGLKTEISGNGNSINLGCAPLATDI